MRSVWIVFVVVALLLMDVIGLRVYGVLVPLLAAGLWMTLKLWQPRTSHEASGDSRDLLVIGALYVVVVGLLRLAFVVLTPQRLTGMFLAYAAALTIGVVGPVVYTTWIRRRPLATLGVGWHRWRTTALLALVFAAVQFSITLWGYAPPQPIDWVPLLTMALTVGVFEAVFFRGFIQGRLEALFGTGWGVLGAAALYAVYHVGYGMPAGEMVFLFGLGVTYATAYRLVENILVLWPLLTPMGSFFNQLASGDLAGQLPWASMAGFGDVLAVMGVALWLASRSERRRAQPARATRSPLSSEPSSTVS